MKQELENAIRLREAGQHEAARTELLRLVHAAPDDPVINYHCAWAHDNLGLEVEAIEFYERALANGLDGNDLQHAILGLGSSYRCLGQHDKSVEILRKGVERFPLNRGLQVFLALSLHGAQQSAEAMAILLMNLAETSSDQSIGLYKRALMECAKELS